MANKNDAKPALPPYLPFKTFHSFIKRLKETVVPRRIDTTLLRAYSGSVQSQLRGTLKFFGLVDEAEQTTDRLRELVAASDKPEWQSCLGKAVSDAYRELISGLDLQAATRGELEERFKHQGADGEVLRKCVAFYVAAATAGGIALSPHIIAERRGRPIQSRGRGKKSKEEIKGTEEGSREVPTQPGTIRFTLPLPSDPSVTATISVSDRVTSQDWEWIDSTMRGHIERRKKADK